MGLRELKKARTRQAVQQAALHLFGTQGYAATTVEQIAAAAEISTATFYRYYSDKEDIVFGGDDDRDVVEEVISARPPTEPIADTIGALFERLAVQVEDNRDAFIVRMRLMHGVRGLQARRWATRQKTADLLAWLLAPRAGTDPDDPQLRLAIAVALAAEAEVLFYWTRTGGTIPLAGLLADALAKIEPALRVQAAPRESQAAG